MIFLSIPPEAVPWSLRAPGLMKLKRGTGGARRSRRSRKELEEQEEQEEEEDQNE